ncbi:MAG TPA: hypothetical protein EYP30_06380 [Archaeoglobaceae archaeon]|nr:hypothetical protein [Archaeoglobaceae archaeon]
MEEYVNDEIDPKITEIFLRVREKFKEIKDIVSLIKPCFYLHMFSPGFALKFDEFEKLLGFKPEIVYRSNKEVYAISAIYRIDDDITTGIIAHEFAEILAKEKGIDDHVEVDRICIEKGFGEHLLYALQSDFLPGMVERVFIDREDLQKRIRNLRDQLNSQK